MIEESCPMNFAEKTCTPCRGGIPPMTPDEAAAFAKDVPEWELYDGATKIRRTFSFEDFRSAFGFVTRLAEIAEEEGHHPDITFGWGYATVVLFTHKIKGLHENDFIIAAKYDRAFAEMRAG